VAVTDLPRRANLPSRDGDARARLHEVARGAAPVVLARDRAVPLPGPLGDLVPGGTVAREELRSGSERFWCSRSLFYSPGTKH